MIEDLYFASVITIIIISLAVFKGVLDIKKRARLLYLEEMKIQEELAQNRLNQK